MFALNTKIYIDFHEDSTKVLTKIYAKFIHASLGTVSQQDGVYQKKSLIQILIPCHSLK
jgi:hypothetical protein